jgi:stringent starvation protein B
LGELRVYLNPKAPGVVCPERFKREPYIVLRYGDGMMTGLEVTADGVMATLLFSGQEHETYLPWASVFMMCVKETEDGIMYREDVPQSLAIALRMFRRARSEQKSSRPLPHLALVN